MKVVILTGLLILSFNSFSAEVHDGLIAGCIIKNTGDKDIKREKYFFYSTKKGKVDLINKLDLKDYSGDAEIFKYVPFLSIKDFDLNIDRKTKKLSIKGEYDFIDDEFEIDLNLDIKEGKQAVKIHDNKGHCWVGLSLLDE